MTEQDVDCAQPGAKKVWLTPEISDQNIRESTNKGKFFAAEVSPTAGAAS